MRTWGFKNRFRNRSLTVAARFTVATLIVLSLTSNVFALQSDGGSGASAQGVSTAQTGSLLEALLFYVVGGCAVVAALAVCFTKNIVRMAVWLLITLASVAMLYFLLAANFVGAIQLIVYAGGTLILLIFGVMLTSKSPWVRFQVGKVELFYAAVVCGALVMVLGYVLAATQWPPTQANLEPATVADVGRSLMTTYVAPFEVAGVLLMIVMVGAAHLARQEEPPR